MVLGSHIFIANAPVITIIIMAMVLMFLLSFFLFLNDLTLPACRTNKKLPFMLIEQKFQVLLMLIENITFQSLDSQKDDDFALYLATKISLNFILVMNRIFRNFQGFMDEFIVQHPIKFC